jgi:L-fuculose-phosphate aldolase
VEIFLGDVPIAKYDTPGSQEFADTILPFVHKSQVIILANHGTVSFGETVEKAYWATEILDAYCRMLMLARGLGSVHYFSEPEERALLKLKEKWGMADPRLQAPGNCDLCANDTFRESWKDAGVQPRAFSPPSFCDAGERGEGRGESAMPQTAGAGADAVPSAANVATEDQEALVKAVTDRVMAMLAIDSHPQAR